MNALFEIDYEIEAVFDEYGDFPLHCVALLFDLLNINGNIIIKNQFSIKTEKATVISIYIENSQNSYYEWSNAPDGNYCLWIKQSISSNQDLLNVFKLQGIHLSYIHANDVFDWEDFIGNWKKDERYLLLSDQASFICNVLDMDRRLNLNFSVTEYPIERIISVIDEWERLIKNIAGSSKMRRTVTEMRGEFGNKQLVRLSFLN